MCWYMLYYSVFYLRFMAAGDGYGYLYHLIVLIIFLKLHMREGCAGRGGLARAAGEREAAAVIGPRAWRGPAPTGGRRQRVWGVSVACFGTKKSVGIVCDLHPTPPPPRVLFVP